ncbi:ABC transporter substrate-binding protein [Kaistia dalseonensis]|uniref:Polar amino acid transport system substrate-binding protein n=1 Tax=Kaistia dalseonensis TaxID=410840 RepID=A0ABU0H2B7_9HYPH|nr:ABC transporter substrate-binding protein [Kaistia dalseonensis]MCX5493883.1 ABC transporter substrate-binding protein [Kaistia dalseonensis]MDQ0436449.1 polar amino acid transport system substrate-binding protein [Kaistia dalseonensis]
MRFATRIALAAAAILAATLGAEAKDWKTIRIGTEGAYPPFNFIDSNQQLQGFDIDIAKAVCEKLKAECTFVAQDWDGIIPALQAGKFDAIFASMSITDERKKVVDFSRAYYNTPSAFFAVKGSGITDNSPAGLKGKTLGAQSSTIQSGYLESNYKDFDVKLYPTQDEVNLDLISGRIDALLVDKVVGTDWLKTKDGSCCEEVGADVPLGGGVGAAVRKDDTDLRDQISKAIEEIKADGTYAKLNAKYFDFSIWKD